MKKRKKDKKEKKEHKKKVFFNSELSQKLWIPSDLQIQDTPVQLKNTWFSSQISCSKNLNSIPLKKFNLPSLTSCLRSKKLEIFPNSRQKKTLLQWIDLYRLVYNQTVRYFRKNPKAKKSFFTTRKVIKQGFPISLINSIKKSKIPSHTLDYAIKDVIDAYSSAFSNLKAGNITHFRLRYKKKKSPRQIMTIEASAFSLSKKKEVFRKKMYQEEDQDGSPENYLKYLFGYTINDYFLSESINHQELKNSFCNSVLGTHIKTSEEIKSVDKNCRLGYYPRLDAFYLYVPYDKETKKFNQKDICVLDPGMRTFQTGYTSEEVLDLGKGTANKIGYLLRESDRCEKSKKKYHSIQRKLKNKIEELHNKVANYLTKRFQCIIVGNVSTKDTNRRKTSKLRKKTKRIFSTLGHTTFRSKLDSKCQERGVYYKIVDESYTSKTCSNCGNYKENLKGEKTYRCQKCQIVIDRDVNACRNILIKNQEWVLHSSEAK